jgi:Predicted metal-dependent hydrolase of the TIM-barrel fold
MSSELHYVDVHCGWGGTTCAPGWSDASEIRTALQMRGIGKALVASRTARLFDPVEGNDELAAGVVNEGGAVDLRGWLVAHPARVADAVAQMRRYLLSDRFVGVALYPDPFTGRPVTARDASEIVKVFLRYGKPLLIHTPSAAAMAETVDIAQMFSGVKVIASGMGGSEWREALRMASKPSNLLMDISGALCPEKVDFAAETMGGVRKLLFASGAPETDPAAVLSVLFESGLSQEDRARILYGNANRLFDLAEDEEEPVVLSAMNSLTP